MYVEVVKAYFMGWMMLQGILDRFQLSGLGEQDRSSAQEVVFAAQERGGVGIIPTGGQIVEFFSLSDFGADIAEELRG